MASDFKNAEELLDALYDHVRGEDEWDENDDNWFDEKFGSFFRDDGVGPKPVSRRRQRHESVAKPKRRPGTVQKDDNKSEGVYGLFSLGKKETA